MTYFRGFGNIIWWPRGMEFNPISQGKICLKRTNLVGFRSRIGCMREQPVIESCSDRPPCGSELVVCWHGGSVTQMLYMFPLRVNYQGMNPQVEQWGLGGQERTIFGHFIKIKGKPKQPNRTILKQSLTRSNTVPDSTAPGLKSGIGRKQILCNSSCVQKYPKPIYYLRK